MQVIFFDGIASYWSAGIDTYVAMRCVLMLRAFFSCELSIIPSVKKCFSGCTSPLYVAEFGQMKNENLHVVFLDNL